MSIFVDPRTRHEVPGAKLVVPVCSLDGADRLHIEGSGFFIANGLVATAKHVLYPRGQREPFSAHQLVVVHMIDPEAPTAAFRQVQAMFLHPSADVALLHLAGLRDNDAGEVVRNLNLILTTRHPEVGERVATFAYPGTFEVEAEVAPGTIDHQLHFEVGWYEGDIRGFHPDGLGLTRGQASFDCSVDLRGLSSGGPALDSRGRVYGVNSSSMPEAYSLVCPTSYVLEIEVLDMPLDGRVVRPRMTLQEIADLGYLALNT